VTRCIFLPKCYRYITTDTVPVNKPKIFWSEDESKDNINQEAFEDEFFTYGKIKEVFREINTFVNCMHYNKQYMYHPDLQNNRFESATLMIDTYCTAKIPKVIHISDYPYDKAMPWFNFKSGVVATDIQELVNNNRAEVPGLANIISEKGNRLIAHRILEIIRENNWDV
jgi:hypothetical protein